MLMTRWQPHGTMWEELGRLRREMERVFSGYGATEGPEFSVSYPAVNVWEDADNLYLEAELPGLKLEDLNIQIVEGSRLVVSGERKPPEAGKGVWQRQERGFGKFERTIVLAVPVNADKVEARFESGVLFITLPRAESAKPRRITVKAG